MAIAPSACVDSAARIGADCEIGPGCVVGPKVRLGDGCRLMANVVIVGNTEVGPRNTFYPGCVVGCAPQDLKYQGGDTRLQIGEGNVFREHVTLHPGTELGGGITTIGSFNQLQIGAHIAHDCVVEDHCVMSNSVLVAGHCHIEHHANISALVGVQQFVTIGRYSFIAGMTRVAYDVPPFTTFAGYDGAVVSINEIGLKRWGFTPEQIDSLWKLHKCLFSRRADRTGKSISDRLTAALSNGSLQDCEQYLLEFLSRSVHDGVYGRFLESRRRELRRLPEFYAKSAAG